MSENTIIAGCAGSRPIDRVLAALEAAGCKPKPSGEGRWSAPCPAHPDRRPSLSVGVGRDDRAVVFCHADKGCTFETIAAAMDMKPGDFFANKGEHLAFSYGARGTTRFPARRPGGPVVAYHVRTDGPEGKDYHWTGADGTRGLNGTPADTLALFNAERLADPPDGADVLLVEGERACEALMAHEFVAVGTVTGSAGCPTDAVLAPLVRLRVLLWPDADAPGEKHMGRIAARLAALGCKPWRIRWPDAPAKGDAADALTLPDGVALVERLIATAAPWETAQQQPRAGRPVLVCAADVVAVEPCFAWRPYVPLGKVTLIFGDPGSGKTWLAVSIAASLTRGAVPADPSAPRIEPCGVVYCTAEDGWDDTIRPRLDAAGADVRLVMFFKGIETAAGGLDPMTFDDMAALDEALTLTKARLIVFDPVQGFFGAGADFHRANEVRARMHALMLLAERHSAAVVLIGHMRKAGNTRAMTAGLGSIDFLAAVRSALVVGHDPADDSRSIVVHQKHSLTMPGPSLVFTIRDNRFEWIGATSLGFDDLYPGEGRSSGSAIAEASDFLLAELASCPVPSPELFKRGADAGISKSALEAAKKRLGVKSRKEGFGDGGRWLWSLPPADGTVGGAP